MAVRDVYVRLTALLKELSHLHGIQGLLSWDQQVMLPAGASASRAAQLSSLAGVVHEKATATELADILRRLASVPPAELERELNVWERANVRDAQRNYDHEARVPKQLAQHLAQLEADGYTCWVKARQAGDFGLFAPLLKSWLEALRQKAACIDATKRPYAVMLDQFERGMTVERIDTLFADLKAGLLPLIQKINKVTKAEGARALPPNLEFPVELQKDFNFQVARDIGFDTNIGRFDVSEHPFTGGAHATDVRMTTRYKPTDLIEGVTGTVHETGHTLYEQGRNAEYADLPVSEAMSMGIHESQSLLWERMVGLSLPFWRHFWPKATQTFPKLDASAISAEDFHRIINASKPGFIRVEADEVTYPMHIILRYEIERDLFDGRITVDELPAVWNKKMVENLGIEPENVQQGILQDPHWAEGCFGYFPTYTLGAIYACQFFQQAQKEMPTMPADILVGDFSKLKGWLNKNIHVKGSLAGSGDVLCTEVTGRSLDAKLFVQYLTEKYTKLYNLD